MRPAIIASNISKKYIITHRDPYGTLRDTITNSAAKLFRRSRDEGREELWALRDVSFVINEGDRVGIIGRNGAGKSTLLKIISRITPPTTGFITFRGRVASLLEVGTGFHPELTGRENIILNGTILGMTQREIRKKFDEIVEFAEIERFLDTPVKRYSSGMYVRLAFSVAAYLESEILIVDEVLAVGDLKFQEKCLGTMNDIQQRGRTILFVSHNMTSIKQLCTRVVLLERGTIAFDGHPFAAVGKYIGHGSIIRATTDWGENGPIIGSTQLLRVSVANLGKAATPDISTELPIDIAIRFRVRKEGVKIGTTVLLYNEANELVFTSPSNHEPVWHLRPRPAAVFESVCELPANLLAQGRYTVTLVIWEGFYESGEKVEDALCFMAHERGLVRGDLPYEISDGLVRPLLTWTSKMISQ